MQIRFANPDDKAVLKSIWRYCFDDKAEFVDWFFEEKYNYGNTLVACEMDNPVSNLQLIPYNLSFKDRQVDASYMVGVATMPEARGKGYVDALIRESLNVMRQRGNLIGLLLPFKFDFYRKYGWELCYSHNAYKFEPSMLKSMIVKYGEARQIDFKSLDDVNTMMRLYSEFMKGVNRYNGYIIRSSNNWKNKLTDLYISKMKGYFIKDNSNEEGYILYSILGKELNIHEMVYTTTNAYRALLGFIYAHSAQINIVNWKAPINDKTFNYLSDPRQCVGIAPFLMARVIDVGEILKLLCKFVKDDFNLTIEIKDELADWNNGLFQIKGDIVSPKRDNVQNRNDIKNNTGSFEPDISCSINIFTQLAMGYISVSDVCKLGLLNVKKDDQAIEKANMIFKLENNYINDYY